MTQPGGHGGAALTWSHVPGSPGGFAISGSGPTDIWLVAFDGSSHAFGRTMRGDGVTWTPIADQDGGCTEAWGTALWVASHDDVFVSSCAYIGRDGVHRWDGSSWVAYSLGDNRNVDEFWGSGPNDIWGARVDGGYLGHWDGSTWSYMSSALGGVLAGGAPQDFWLAFPQGDYLPGVDGGLTMVRPTTLQHHTPSGNYDMSVDLAAIGCSHCSVRAGWASAVDDVWFVGNTALHFDGRNWKWVPTPVTTTQTTLLRGVWGSSKDDVWAVGDGGVIVHFDGVRWTSVASPTTTTLEAVWSSGPSDVWAIGDAVYHATR